MFFLQWLILHLSLFVPMLLFLAILLLATACAAAPTHNTRRDTHLPGLQIDPSCGLTQQALIHTHYLDVNRLLQMALPFRPGSGRNTTTARYNKDILESQLVQVLVIFMTFILSTVCLRCSVQPYEREFLANCTSSQISTPISTIFCAHLRLYHEAHSHLLHGHPERR